MVKRSPDGLPNFGMQSWNILNNKELKSCFVTSTSREAKVRLYIFDYAKMRRLKFIDWLSVYQSVIINFDNLTDTLRLKSE